MTPLPILNQKLSNLISIQLKIINMPALISTNRRYLSNDNLSNNNLFCTILFTHILRGKKKALNSFCLSFHFAFESREVKENFNFVNKSQDF